MTEHYRTLATPTSLRNKMTQISLLTSGASFVLFNPFATTPVFEKMSPRTKPFFIGKEAWPIYGSRGPLWPVFWKKLRKGIHCNPLQAVGNYKRCRPKTKKLPFLAKSTVFLNFLSVTKGLNLIKKIFRAAIANALGSVGTVESLKIAKEVSKFGSIFIQTLPILLISCSDFAHRITGKPWSILVRCCECCEKWWEIA